MKKVCFLVSEHPFLDARIFKKAARSLHSHGYEVTIIVPRKNGYLFDVDGTVFDDQFRENTFYHEGIKVVTYEQQTWESRLKQLTLNLHSKKQTGFIDQLTVLGIAEGADIYHAHEFYSLYSGVMIKHAFSVKGKRCKLIYDSHELEPDPLTKESQNKKRWKNNMLTAMLSETDHLITVSPSIQSWYSSIDPKIPSDVIYNSPPLTDHDRQIKGMGDGLRLVFEGRLDPGRFKKLIEIVQQCNKYFDFKVRLIGGKGNSHHDKDYLVPAGKVGEKIEWCGWLEYDAIPEAMGAADIGWIDLDAANFLNHRYAMPNKFFSYLSNGIPVLVNQCDDMERFIETYHCGYVLKKRCADVADYVQALMEIYDNREQLKKWSRQARHIMEEHFSWQQMEKRLLHIYARLES